MRIQDLSPMALAIMENISVESHSLHAEFESKIAVSKDENAFLEYIMEYIGFVMNNPQMYIDIINKDGRTDLSYFYSFMQQSKSGIQQILSIPHSMRFSIKKEDTD